MNRLVSMKQCAEMLGIQGTDICRRTRRRLRQVAENDTSFQLFRLPNRRDYYTTEADLKRLLPELFAPQKGAEELFEDQLDELKTEIKDVKRRLSVVENRQFTTQRSA